MAWTEMMTPFPKKRDDVVLFFGHSWRHSGIRPCTLIIGPCTLILVWFHCIVSVTQEKKIQKIRIYHFARQTCQIKIQDLFHGIFEWKLIGKCLDASSATKGQTSTENQMKSTSTVDSQLVEGTMGSGTKELYRSLTDATEDSEFAVRPGIATRGGFRFSAT